MPPSNARNLYATHFGELVTRLRTQRGWTLEALAHVSGMSSKYLGVLERGGNMPTLMTLLRLARTFGMTAAELVAEFERSAFTQ